MVSSENRAFPRPASESELDPDEVLTTVQRTDLPDSVAALADDYERLIGIRDRFLWKWIYTLFPAFTLDCVATDATATVREQKTILTLFVTILDDLAEHEKDRATFDEARKYPLPRQTVNADDTAVDSATLEFAGRVWTAFEDRFTAAPRHSEISEIFRYDLRQTITVMEYSRLISEHHAMANLTGAYHYTPHNMVMFPYADIDLAHSPAFETTDLAVLRETIWDLQKMARIGNWISTWERELDEGDYSSGILIAALNRDLVTPADLTDTDHEPSALIDRIHDASIEADFLDEWNARYTQIQERNPTAQSVDLDALIDGMKTVMRYHLGTRGHK